MLDISVASEGVISVRGRDTGHWSTGRHMASRRIHGCVYSVSAVALPIAASPVKDGAVRPAQLITSLVCNVELWHCIQKSHNIILALNEALSFPCILDTNNASFFFF